MTKLTLVPSVTFQYESSGRDAWCEAKTVFSTTLNTQQAAQALEHGLRAFLANHELVSQSYKDHVASLAEKLEQTPRSFDEALELLNPLLGRYGQNNPHETTGFHDGADVELGEEGLRADDEAFDDHECEFWPELPDENSASWELVVPLNGNPQLRVTSTVCLW